MEGKIEEEKARGGRREERWERGRTEKGERKERVLRKGGEREEIAKRKGGEMKYREREER